jgi:tripartite-type tricarboxylate transporter receptor subunit TctC
MARFMSLSVTPARPLAAPPGVPAERVALLRGAFDATLRDPAFLADAQKRGADIDPMSGAETQDVVAAFLSTPKPVIDDLKVALGGFLK